MPRVAVAQMVSTANVQENLDIVASLCSQASEQEAVMLVLPENFACMPYNEKGKHKMAEVYGDGSIQHSISTLAASYGLWIIAGTIPLKTNGSRLRASCLVYDDKGKVAARYDKIHMFDVKLSEHESYEESLTSEPGSDIVVIDTPIGRVGLSICYDLRFAELYQQLLRKGAEIFTLPASFTFATGKAHWHVLLRARAIEHLAYMLAANQGGIHDNGRATYGHSMIVEPWGNIIGVHQNGTGMVVRDIDLTRLHQLRKQFPCNEHHVLLTDKRQVFT